jgi:hypothetical protein
VVFLKHFLLYFPTSESAVQSFGELISEMSFYVQSSSYGVHNLESVYEGYKVHEGNREVNESFYQPRKTTVTMG